MSENFETNSTTNQDSQPEYPDRRDARRSRLESRREARASRSAGTWVGGAVLIALGIILMLQNLAIFDLENWWALFILLPAVGAFGNAWNAYRNAGGYLNAQARGSLAGGVLLTMVAAVFLFQLDWTMLGPVILILAGIGVLINALLPAGPKADM